MKWKCTYSPEEQEEATADLKVLLQRHPGAKVRRDKSKSPRLCVYVTTQDPESLSAVGKVLESAR